MESCTYKRHKRVLVTSMRTSCLSLGDVAIVVKPRLYCHSDPTTIYSKPHEVHESMYMCGRGWYGYGSRTTVNVGRERDRVAARRRNLPAFHSTSQVYNAGTTSFPLALSSTFQCAEGLPFSATAPSASLSQRAIFIRDTSFPVIVIGSRHRDRHIFELFSSRLSVERFAA